MKLNYVVVSILLSVLFLVSAIGLQEKEMAPGSEIISTELL